MRQEKSTVTFPKCNQDQFFKELKGAVENYFKTKKIDRMGNFELYLKSLLMVVSFIAIYSMLYFFAASIALSLICYLFLGLNATLLMFNLGHDICHDAYCKNRFVNSALLIFGEILFANKHSWKLKHNEGHHLYTNIEGHDDDIDLHNMIRMSRTEKRYALHRVQHWYAPLLYCFLSLQWLFFSDLAFQVKVFRKKMLGWAPVIKTVACKLLHLVLFLVLPLILLPLSPWVILSGFTLMHFVFGFSMSIIFQLAHVVDNVEFPKPNESGEMEHSWARHEMETTSDFSTSKVAHYLLGGLTFQVEHHLFPNISHVHYRKIAPIVKSIAEKHSVPYRFYPTIFKAIKAHFRFLKHLGRVS